MHQLWEINTNVHTAEEFPISYFTFPTSHRSRKQKRLPGRLGVDRAANVRLHHARLPPGDGHVQSEAVVRLPGGGAQDPRVEEGPRHNVGAQTTPQVQLQADCQAS